MIISECLTKQWSIKGIVFTNRAHEQIQISFRPFINLQHKKGKKNKTKTTKKTLLLSCKTTSKYALYVFPCEFSLHVIQLIH